MYSIDWNKYLSEDRMSQSELKNSKSFDQRNAFDSDFGRIVFCSAFRRMHDKAQLFPLTNGDKVHTRLTHSIEVMNLAQSFVQHLCRSFEFVQKYSKETSYQLEQKMSSVVKTAALIHDIGNPPFGHQGERVICKYFSDGNGMKYLKDISEDEKLDFTEFDGNAQGLRIITKNQYVGTLYGLNLTCATIGAFIKYPNYNKADKKSYVGCHKHGVFLSEKDMFLKVAEKCDMRLDNAYKRHPLSYIVEAADTICYSVMDLEDGIRLGMVSIPDIIKELNQIDIPTPTIDISNPQIGDVVKLRIILINYLVGKALDTFVNNLEKIDKNRELDELLKADPVCALINGFAKNKLFVTKEVVANEIYGEAVLNKLLDATLKMVFDENKSILHIMSPSMIKSVTHHHLKREPSPNELDDTLHILTSFEKIHLVIDWISGMTDGFAVETCKDLYGL